MSWPAARPVNLCYAIRKHEEGNEEGALGAILGLVSDAVAVYLLCGVKPLETTPPTEPVKWSARYFRMHARSYANVESQAATPPGGFRGRGRLAP